MLGSHLFAGTPIYLDGTDYRLMLKHPVAELDTAQSWFGSLFFLQGIRTTVFGSNGPLWSLSYEFWYYLLFPIGLLVVSRKSTVAAKAAYLAAGLLILAFIGKGIALYFLIWLLGTFVCVCRPPRIFASKAAGCLFALLFAASLLAPRFKLLPNGLLSDFLVAVTFAAFLLFLLNAKLSAPGKLYTQAARALSNISYSLYLLHVPLLIFLNGLIIRHGGRWQPTLGHLGLGVLVAGIVFLYTYGVWLLTEARTGQVRAKITSLLSKTRPAVQRTP